MAIFASVAGGLAAGAAGSLLSGGGSSGGGSGGRAHEFKGNNGLFNTSLNAVPGQDILTSEAVGQLGDIQGGNLDAAQGFFGQAQNNQSADMAGQLGQSFLGNMGAFDPMQIAQMQFDQFNPILQHQQNQDFLGMESRLFNQGQLGAGGFSGGNNQMGALFDSFGRQNQQLLYDSFGQGLQAQQQQANLASQFSQLDPQLRGLFQSLGTQGLNNALGIDAAGLDRFATFSGAQGGGVGGGGGGIQSPGLGQQVGAGLINSGANQITNGFNGLFNPVAPTDRNGFGPGGR
jgi:hypothetical protein